MKVPFLMGTLLNNGIFNSMCLNPEKTWFSGPTGYWVRVMLISKFPELFDTFFIIARKRPLIFLHWYHHVTVLLFSWNAFATLSGSGLYFVSMNFTVHAIMYGYYCLQALKLCPRWFPSVSITVIQILQMLVGTCVCALSWYYKISGTHGDCHADMTNLVLGAAMYASYLYLFVVFALEKIGKPRGPRVAAKSE